MRSQLRKTGLTIAILAFVVSMSACSTATSNTEKSAVNQTEGTLTWYTDDDAQEVGPVIQEFTKQTGIKVVLLATAGVAPRVASESASDVHTADVVSFAGPPNVLMLTQAGVLEKLPETVTSALPEKSSVLVSENSDWFTNQASFWGVFYNTENVDPAHIPTDFNSLLDPYWEGKFSIPISTNDTAVAGYYQLSEAPEIGKEFLSDLGKNKPIVLASSGQQVSDVIVGNQLGGITNDNAVWAQIEKGAPLKFIYPESGTTASLKYNALVKDAPHPKAAEAFLEFLASKKAAQLLSEGTGKLSLFPGIQSAPAGRPEISDIKFFPAPDPQTLVDAQSTMVPFLKDAFNE